MKNIWNSLVEKYRERQENAQVRKAVEYATTICTAHNIGLSQAYEGNDFRIYRGNTEPGCLDNDERGRGELEVAYRGVRVLNYSHQHTGLGEDVYCIITRQQFQKDFSLWLPALKNVAATAEVILKQRQKAQYGATRYL